MALRPLLSQLEKALIVITEHDVYCARKNWVEWQDVFEHRGPPSENPLLTDRDRFRKFLSEYSVWRTVKAGTSDTLRLELHHGTSELDALLGDTTGVGLDDMNARLRSRFSSKENGSLLSLISKVAAFLAPDQFIAWDRFAKRGTKLALAVPLGRPFTSYAAYIEAVRSLRPQMDAVERACGGAYPSEWSAERGRFLLRILDVYLMRIGGRSTMPTKPGTGGFSAAPSVK